MIKLTNDIIFDSVNILSGVCETGKLGYACARNLRKLRDAGKEFNDKRDELIMQYGIPQEDGSYTIPAEKIEELNKAIREYADIEHEVDVMRVSEDIFCNGNLDTQTMYALDWMVERDE